MTLLISARVERSGRTDCDNNRPQREVK